MVQVERFVAAPDARGHAASVAQIDVRMLAEQSLTEDASLSANRIRRASSAAFQTSGTLPSPKPAISFLALPDSNDRTPPDPQGAVGVDSLMTTLNTSVRFQDRSGGLIRTLALSAFWSSLNNPDPFDPRCVYDPYRSRWIFSALANRMSTNSALLIGTSRTSDPAGQWNLRRIDVGGGTNWIDFPNLGFNKDFIVVQAVMKTVSDNKSYESQIFVFDKNDLYGGGAGSFAVFRRLDLGPTQLAAITLDPDIPVLYLVSSPVESKIANELRVYSITGMPGAEVLSLVEVFTAAEPWATTPPNNGNIGLQPQSTNRIHLPDSSVQSAVFRNGALWVAHHVFLPADNPARSAIQWWQLRIGNLSANAILQLGRIDDPRFSFGYPSIAVNRRNDVLIGYSRFGANQFASANYSFRLASDPPNTLREDTVLKAGEGVYFKTRQTGRNRWGDYSSTVVDPRNDLSFWTLQPFAAAPEGDPNEDGSGRWGTWWGKIESQVSVVDSDADGMPNDWETLHGFDPMDPADGAIDSDSDGHSNRSEFQAGTHPRDAASVLQFTRVLLEGDLVTLRFHAVTGKRYRIERNDKFGGGNWSLVNEIVGTGNTETVSDRRVSGNREVFYRIQLFGP